MGEPLHDPHGKVIQWYGLSIEIDERKRAEDRLCDTRIKLAKASRLGVALPLIHASRMTLQTQECA
jgi:hypothetical protein